MTGDATEGESGDGGWPSLAGFLCRMFRGFGARSEDAEDLAQESLVRMMGRPGGEVIPASLGFVATVGRNLWRDRLRQAFRRRPVAPADALDQLPADAVDPQKAAEASELRRHLHRALEQLDPRHRGAIALVILEGASYAEAARILGVPRGTVKSRIHYGIQRLRAQLEAVDAEAEHVRGRRPC